MMLPRETARPRRAIHCWACEELLALVDRDQFVIVEAEAETTTTVDNWVITSPCGARTISPTA